MTDINNFQNLIKISNEELNEINNQLNWIDVIKKYTDLDLQNHWNWFKTVCFMHNENTPSLIINQSKKVIKCFWCWYWRNNILFFLKDYFQDKSIFDTINRIIDELDENIKDKFLLINKIKNFQINFKETLKNKNNIFFNDIINRIIFFKWWIYYFDKNNLNVIKNLLNINIKNNIYLLKISNWFIWYFWEEERKKNNNVKYLNFNGLWFKTRLSFYASNKYLSENLLLFKKYIWNKITINSLKEWFYKNLFNNLKIEENFLEYIEEKKLKWMWYKEFLEELSIFYLDKNYLYNDKNQIKKRLFLTEWYFDWINLEEFWFSSFSQVSLDKKAYFSLRDVLKDVEKIQKNKIEINMSFDYDDNWKKFTYFIWKLLEQDFKNKFNIDNIKYFDYDMFKNLIIKILIIENKFNDYIKNNNIKKINEIINYIDILWYNVYNESTVKNFKDIYSKIWVVNIDVEVEEFIKNKKNEDIILKINKIKDINDVFKIIKWLFFKFENNVFDNSINNNIDYEIKKVIFWFLLFMLKKVISFSYKTFVSNKFEKEIKKEELDKLNSLLLKIIKENQEDEKFNKLTFVSSTNKKNKYTVLNNTFQDLTKFLYWENYKLNFLKYILIWMVYLSENNEEKQKIKNLIINLLNIKIKLNKNFNLLELWIVWKILRDIFENNEDELKIIENYYEILILFNLIIKEYELEDVFKNIWEKYLNNLKEYNIEIHKTDLYQLIWEENLLNVISEKNKIINCFIKNLNLI